MRKAYQKPLLYAESYELSQHIAACDIRLQWNDAFTCKGSAQQGSIFGMNQNLFTRVTYSRTGPCKVYFEEYCYTNSASGFATHTS